MSASPLSILFPLIRRGVGRHMVVQQCQGFFSEPRVREGVFGRQALVWVHV